MASKHSHTLVMASKYATVLEMNLTLRSSLIICVIVVTTSKDDRKDRIPYYSSVKSFFLIMVINDLLSDYIPFKKFSNDTKRIDGCRQKSVLSCVLENSVRTTTLSTGLESI